MAVLAVVGIGWDLCKVIEPLQSLINSWALGRWLLKTDPLG
jgi:hypothetical protein